ncbi:hypothetical protein RRG08_003310 [Elysia crispata]|uniref:Uncharacterized protein n=1 Tax=Elysia crispata TaxID=231223 RepID=A0AAE1DM33_9GAST|nr:hypothetical protein RRG08_003310 [Elysia crispata]
MISVAGAKGTLHLVTKGDHFRPLGISGEATLERNAQAMPTSLPDRGVLRRDPPDETPPRGSDQGVVKQKMNSPLPPGRAPLSALACATRALQKKK